MFVPQRPTLTIKQTDRPLSGLCSSGHHVPAPDEPNGTWEREPGKLEAVRFFVVNGMNVCGTYCELCLTVSQQLANNYR
jgi:hypothetical protein